MAMRMGKMLIISDHPQDVGPIFRQSYQFESAGAAQYPRYLPPKRGLVPKRLRRDMELEKSDMELPHTMA